MKITSMKKIVILILIFSFGCLSNSETLTSNNVVTPIKQGNPEKEIAKWNQLIGSWYGSQLTSDGTTRKWVMKHQSNGKYLVHFKFYKGSTLLKEQKEYGEWGVSGDIIFSTLKGWVDGEKLLPAEPVNPYCYNAYKIIKLTENSIEYKHVDSGNSYIVNRVSDTLSF